MFEGNTILGGIAARTKTIALGLLVAGVGYRNPAQHAKITTTLDVISGGRAFHGIGAGWFEGEHRAYGFAFPSLKERFERLEDHLRIARAMFTEEQSTVTGDHHSVDGAYNNLRPLRGDIPILVGGSGERKTLRMVAQYADGCTLRRPRAGTAPPRRPERPLRVRRTRSSRDHQDRDDLDRDRRDGERGRDQARRDARGGVPSSGWPPPRPEHPRRSSSAHMHPRRRHRRPDVHNGRRTTSRR